MIKKLKEERINKGIFITVILLCLCSIIYGIANYDGVDKAIYGTYRSEDASNDFFLVLKKDNSYIVYEEYHILDEGSYQIEYSYEHIKVCKLNSENKSGSYTMVNIDSSKGLIIRGEDYRRLNKISDIEVYINLEKNDMHE